MAIDHNNPFLRQIVARARNLLQIPADDLRIDGRIDKFVVEYGPSLRILYQLVIAAQLMCDEGDARAAGRIIKVFGDSVLGTHLVFYSPSELYPRLKGLHWLDARLIVNLADLEAAFRGILAMKPLPA